MNNQRLKNLIKKPISLFAFSAIVSVATMLLYNIPFFNYVVEHTNQSTPIRVFLIASLVVVMLLVNFLMTYLIVYLMRIVGRILLALMAIINVP